MDSMTIKHVECFGPALVEVWELQATAQEILDRWNIINLYSMSRGINRFKGLLMMLEELKSAGRLTDDLLQFKDWVENTDELSAQSLKKRIGLSDDTVLQKALLWSDLTNEKIKALPEDKNKPFEGVLSALNSAYQDAAIVIVSSANGQAVQEEWHRCGLLPFVDTVMTQEHGSKSSCIAKVIRDGFAKECILMVGDAPGDRDAAMSNGVLFYPILAGKETYSWEIFMKTILADFIRGEYQEQQMKNWIDKFEANLAQ
jgi:phosphoglycolate phosphatase-like HAD superfamily hydrolase